MCGYTLGVFVQEDALCTCIDTYEAYMFIDQQCRVNNREESV